MCAGGSCAVEDVREWSVNPTNGCLCDIAVRTPLASSNRDGSRLWLQWLTHADIDRPVGRLQLGIREDRARVLSEREAVEGRLRD